MPAETTTIEPMAQAQTGTPTRERVANHYEIEPGRRYLYGTAGFRMASSHMGPVAYRVGLLAAALSAHLYGGRPLGIMLTASHNHIDDNGVKLVDPTGSMLPAHLEPLAEEIAATSLPHLRTVISKIISTIGKGSAPLSVTSATLVIGRDTRPSGPALVEAVKAGAAFLQEELVPAVNIIDLDLVTTPELHLATAHIDQGKTFNDDYYLREMLTAYDEAINGIAGDSRLSPGPDEGVTQTLIIDCAHGVGADKIVTLAGMLKDHGQTLRLMPINTSDNGVLNQDCGADFVKSRERPPTNLSLPSSSSSAVRPWAHYASLDGDADRLIYFTFDEQSQFRLIDGDRIAALCALTVSRLLHQASVTLTVGVVQTAYANGASTNYLENILHVPVLCTPTGVKYLHHAAAHSFDIGIYFEANGHGTILFSETALQRLRNGAPASVACRRLLALAHLSNQLVGDGIADMLLVEAMLQMTGLTMRTWVEDLYQERPSCLLKAPVRDRTVLVTSDADRRLIRPEKLQLEIDRLVGTVREGRAFARPSGTEDVVRVYAEAATAEQAQLLAHSIIEILPLYV